LDNLTHSIVGFGVGEVVHRSLPREADDAAQRVRHRLLLLSCALASNFPDLDLFLTGRLPAPLGYLLHHRGHTHTALWLLPQALLLVALLWLCWPAARRLLADSTRARLGLGLSVGVGLALHLAMDYTNSYGLHPWYPLDGRWLYGDMVFIVEPLFWVAIGVPMSLIMRWRLARLFGLIGLFAALVFFAAHSYLRWTSFVALLLIALMCGAAQWRSGERGMAGLLLALGVCAAFVGLQAAASHIGRTQLTTILQRIDPASRVLDVAMTAFPSQPLCWSYVSVESNEADGVYRLRRGVLSVAPGRLAAADCPAGFLERLPGKPLAPGVLQAVKLEASLRELRALKADDCYAEAWLRFGRAPALEAGTLSDYRFSATPGSNFTTLRLGHGHPCPASVPAWGYPRADLLTPGLP